MGMAVWYFTLFVTVGGGIGDQVATRSKSDAIFFSDKAACNRVLDQIKATDSKGDPFHSLLPHRDYTGTHRHSWNRTCRLVPNRV